MGDAMNPNDKDFERLARMMKENGNLEDYSEEEIAQFLRMVVEDIVSDTMEQLDSPEAIAQRETDALFERLGVKK